MVKNILLVEDEARKDRPTARRTQAIMPNKMNGSSAAFELKYKANKAEATPRKRRMQEIKRRVALF